MRRPTYEQVEQLVTDMLGELYDPGEVVALLAKERVRHVMRELVFRVLDAAEK